MRNLKTYFEERNLELIDSNDMSYVFYKDQRNHQVFPYHIAFLDNLNIFGNMKNFKTLNEAKEYWNNVTA